MTGIQVARFYGRSGCRTIRCTILALGVCRLRTDSCQPRKSGGGSSVLTEVNMVSEAEGIRTEASREAGSKPRAQPHQIPQRPTSTLRRIGETGVPSSEVKKACFGPKPYTNVYRT